jgi:hypothetical protein
MRQLIEDVKQKPVDEVQDSAIQIGITERAYYVTGAHMAQTIEERLGKGAIVESVNTGPRHFVEIYNSIVDSKAIIDI